MRILLLRHAEPDYTIDSLTPKGHTEARLLAERLGRREIRDFYVSPLGRARDTAGYTLRHMNRTAETLEWLREFNGTIPDPETGKPRIAWDLKPRFWNELERVQDDQHWMDDPRLQGGTLREVWERTQNGVETMLARYGYRKDGPVWTCEKNNDDTIALFCHFGIAMAIIAILTDMSPMTLWHRYLLLPSSLTELVTEERIPGEVAFRIIRMGDLTHLEAQNEPASIAGLYPMNYTGIDSTDIRINGTKGWIR